MFLYKYYKRLIFKLQVKCFTVDFANKLHPRHPCFSLPAPHPDHARLDLGQEQHPHYSFLMYPW